MYTAPSFSINPPNAEFNPDEWPESAIARMQTATLSPLAGAERRHQHVSEIPTPSDE